jgi:hypothetical protein
METIYYLLKFAFFCFLAGGLITSLYFLYSEYKDWKINKERIELKYLMKYTCLQERIRKAEITEKNYFDLTNDLIDLSRMKYRDKEKNQVLTMTFLEKFRLFSKDEFSPESVFRN